MRIKNNLFSKSFLFSFVAFALLATVIITSLYLDETAVDPKNKESNILIGLSEDNNILSLCVVHLDPKSNSIDFLPIPDNVWIENGVVLQKLYEKRNINNLENAIESIIGAKIDRYLVFTVDTIAELNNEMGVFDYQVQYPFVYKNETKAGYLHIDGNLTKAMFRYQGYDFLNASLSKIGYSYMNTFLSIYTKHNHIQKLTDIISSNSFLKKAHTNLKKNEMKEYCNILSQYSTLSQRTLELSGTYNQASSSTYFIPDNPKSEKNIFK